MQELYLRGLQFDELLAPGKQGYLAEKLRQRKRLRIHSVRFSPAADKTNLEEIRFTPVDGPLLFGVKRAVSL